MSEQPALNPSAPAQQPVTPEPDFEAQVGRTAPQGALLSPVSQELNSKALAAVVLACLAFVAGPLGSIPAVILAHMAMKELKAQNQVTGLNYNMALISAIVGWVLNLLFLFAVLGGVGLLLLAAIAA